MIRSEKMQKEINNQHPRKSITIKALLVVIALLLLAVVGIIVTLAINKDEQQATVFIEEVRAIATLATAEAKTTIIIEKQDAKELAGFKIPGTSRELVLIVPGTVLAGVDLQQVQEQDIEYDEATNKLSITIPHAQFLQEPTLHMDDIIVFSKEGIFRKEANSTEGFAYAAEAQQKMIEELTEQGLLQTAEENAEKALKEFFGHLNYEVSVTFR